MGILDKFRSGLHRTKEKLSHEISRIVTGSPKLNDDMLEEIEFALIGADLGMSMTQRILSSVKDKYESQGSDGVDVLEVARREVSGSFNEGIVGLKQEREVTVVSLVGVNGTGKTTSSAKLAGHFSDNGEKVTLVAADTYRAAAVQQIREWATHLKVNLIANEGTADPAAVAFDGVNSGIAKNMDRIIVDTAGRLHTSLNLMKELENPPDPPLQRRS